MVMRRATSLLSLPSFGGGGPTTTTQHAPSLPSGSGDALFGGPDVAVASAAEPLSSASSFGFFSDVDADATNANANANANATAAFTPAAARRASALLGAIEAGSVGLELGEGGKMKKGGMGVGAMTRVASSASLKKSPSLQTLKKSPSLQKFAGSANAAPAPIRRPSDSGDEPSTPSEKPAAPVVAVSGRGGTGTGMRRSASTPDFVNLLPLRGATRKTTAAETSASPSLAAAAPEASKSSSSAAAAPAGKSDGEVAGKGEAEAAAPSTPPSAAAPPGGSAAVSLQVSTAPAEVPSSSPPSRDCPGPEPANEPDDEEEDGSTVSDADFADFSSPSVSAAAATAAVLAVEPPVPSVARDLIRDWDVPAPHSLSSTTTSARRLLGVGRRLSSVRSSLRRQKKKAKRKGPKGLAAEPPLSSCDALALASSRSADTLVVDVSSGASGTDGDASTVAAASSPPSATMRPPPPSSTPSYLLFPGLPDDVLFLSLSYLCPRDVRSLSETSVAMRGALLDEVGGGGGRRLWVELATRSCAPSAARESAPRGVWPALAAAGGRKKYEFRCNNDNDRTDDADDDARVCASRSPNLSVLLSLSSRTSHPSGPDPSFLERRQMKVLRSDRVVHGRGLVDGGGAGLERGAARYTRYESRAEFRAFEASVPLSALLAPPPPPAESDSSSGPAEGAGPVSAEAEADRSGEGDADADDADEDAVGDDADGGACEEAVRIPVVQFTGRVGLGDRCVRSDAPLPRPSSASCLPPPPPPPAAPAASGSVADSPTLEGGEEEGGSGGGRKRKATRALSSFLRRGGRAETSSRHPQEEEEGEAAPTFGATTLATAAATRRGRRLRILGRLRRGRRGAEAGGGVVGIGGEGCRPMVPFVAPYVREEKRHCSADSASSRIPTAVVDLTPRFVAYFEVSILPKPMQTSPMSAPSPPPSALSSPAHLDCIAVGLSTAAFRHRSLMPGWDHRSYGYHSDDGGMFHGSGEMVRRYGPRYGPGDTVGCGVDYARDGIFFTLNGAFLGYAWTGVVWGKDAAGRGGANRRGIDGSNDEPPSLYPTVGVDTECPVGFNFGERPFRFGLAEFVSQDRKAVKSSLGGLVR